MTSYGRIYRDFSIETVNGIIERALLKKIGLEVGDVRHISSYTHNNGIEPDFTDGEVLFFSE